MAAWWVKIYLPQNYFAIRSVCENRWQIKLTGFSAESIVILLKNPPQGFCHYQLNRR
jgi:hypothetical protein